MTNFPSKGRSLWVESAPKTTYPEVTEGVEIDVAIVGGGIAGLSAAYLLKKAGKRVVVFEKQTLGSATTGFTTGKVSSLHGLSYAQLKQKFGEATARVYAQANEAAISEIEKTIKTEKIDCNWQRDDNYVFTEKPEEVEKLETEAQVAAELGLPASFETTTDLPFEVKGAVRFTNQAKLHSVKYIQGLARTVQGGSSYVFEHSKVINIRDGDTCSFICNGNKVRASDVIIATNVPTPTVAHTIYGALCYPARSYIVAGRLKSQFKGMYITAGSPTRSILPVGVDGERWLLIGGEGHFGGAGGRSGPRYHKLTQYAKDCFGVETTQKWSTWDYAAYDGLPLVGKLYPWSKHVYTAGSFKKWGLTNSRVAAMILADLIIGKKNSWTHTFRSTRTSPITSMPQGLARAFGLSK